MGLVHVDAIGLDDKTVFSWDTADLTEQAALFDRMVNGTEWGIGELTIIRIRGIEPPCSECEGKA